MLGLTVCRRNRFDPESWTHLVSDEVVIEAGVQLEINPTVLDALGSVWHDEIFNPPLIRARLD